MVEQPHKSKIIMCNAKRWLEWCKAFRFWTLEQWKCVLWSDESRFTISLVRRTNLGLVDARRTLPARMHSTSCKVWWRRNSGLGLFFMVQARPISSSEGNLNATAYNDILDNSLLQILWQQFGEGLFLF